MDNAVLAVAGLMKAYGAGLTRVEALRGIDLTLQRGEFVAVMGPSGSGKSSLLHLLAGLDQPTGGSIRIGGVDMAGMSEDERSLLRRRQIGLMFQSFQLLDTLTAEENVALPLAIGGCAADEARQRAARLLGKVGLAHRRPHRPHELSGGEQQRVAIARALVIEPLLLLADEPTGNLDSVQGDNIMTLLRQLVEEHRQTLLMVTHDANHAARADRIIYLRDGRINNGERGCVSAPSELLGERGRVSASSELLGERGRVSAPSELLGERGRVSAPSELLGERGRVSAPSELLGERGRVSAPSETNTQGANITPFAVHVVECVEWSVVPPPCSFNAVSFVAPCAGDALEHAPRSKEAA